SLSDGFVNQVRLYLDANNNGALDPGDVVVGTGTISGSVASITMNAVQRITTTPQTYIMSFVFDPAATVGNTIGFTMPDNTFMVVQPPDVVSGSSLPFTSSSAGILDA